MVCKKLLEEKGASHLFDVRSAGTHADRAVPQFMRTGDFERNFKVPLPTQLTKEMIDGSDIVVALDINVGINILTIFPEVPIEKIEYLNIPDWFSVQKGNIEELFWLLETKLPPMVDRWIALANTEPRQP